MNPCYEIVTHFLTCLKTAKGQNICIRQFIERETVCPNTFSPEQEKKIRETFKNPVYFVEVDEVDNVVKEKLAQKYFSEKLPGDIASFNSAYSFTTPSFY